MKKLSRKEQVKRVIEEAQPKPDPYKKIHAPQSFTEPKVDKNPIDPDEDILLFIRDYNPFLEEWEKDLLTIVDEEAKYFIPMIETKIMNEGWASFWHHRILESLKLEQGLHLEFIVRHNQVVRSIPGQINPYHLGLGIWTDIFHRYDVGRGAVECTVAGHDHSDLLDPKRKDLWPGDLGKTGDRKIFEVREADRDTSFIRNYLTGSLMREMDMFRYETRGDELVVSDVSGEEGWRKVRETIIANVGMNSIPVIKVEDADWNKNRVLYLRHYHDGGRDLQLEYAEKTLAYVQRLWRREVVLETILNGKRALLAYNDKGFSTRAIK